MAIVPLVARVVTFLSHRGNLTPDDRRSMYTDLINTAISKGSLDDMSKDLIATALSKEEKDKEQIESDEVDWDYHG